MAIDKRDDNFIPALMGVSSTDGITPVRIKADPVTGYILARILAISNFSTTNPRIKKDENFISVKCAVTNNAAKTVSPILSDPNNSGNVLADVTLI